MSNLKYKIYVLKEEIESLEHKLRKAKRDRDECKMMRERLKRIRERELERTRRKELLFKKILNSPNGKLARAFIDLQKAAIETERKQMMDGLYEALRTVDAEIAQIDREIEYIQCKIAERKERVCVLKVKMLHIAEEVSDVD